MKTIIYCRVSTIDQAETGYSLPAQEKACRQYAERNSYDVVKVFVEKGESAKTIDRTQLKNLLDFVSKHHKDINAIIVYKLDRLARNMIDYTGLVASFSKLGIDVKSATENVYYCIILVAALTWYARPSFCPCINHATIIIACPYMIAFVL